MKMRWLSLLLTGVFLGWIILETQEAVKKNQIRKKEQEPALYVFQLPEDIVFKTVDEPKTINDSGKKIQIISSKDGKKYSIIFDRPIPEKFVMVRKIGDQYPKIIDLDK